MKTRKDRDWRDYPIGTKAFALMGGYWTKTSMGWKWGSSGGTFPTPGGDWSGEIELPE